MRAMAGREIVALNATAMVAAIATRELSCREVMEAHLSRIEAVNATYNAIVSLRPADAGGDRGDWCRPAQA